MFPETNNILKTFEGSIPSDVIVFAVLHAFGGKRFYREMSCDYELANENKGISFPVSRNVAELTFCRRKM